MNHEMNLENEEFERIKNKEQSVEIRLYDVKRKALKVGDIITFTNRDTMEKVDVKITALENYKTMEELLDSYELSVLGLKEKKADYYTEEEINKYGVLAILFIKL